MSRSRTKIIAIVGPTASGKSDLAVAIAQKINGEVISADSRQVYKGLDIGSGKITTKEMMGVPHHLLSICNPKKVFTVSDFKKQADKKLTEILERNHIPILCGGTGLYIDTVINNTHLPEVPPNVSLRLKLQNKSLPDLQKQLQKLDPKRFKTIDTQNRVRLIRAIEIALALGKVPEIPSSSPYDCLYIGIKPTDEILKTKIHKRLLSRIKQGMMAEVKALHTKGLSWKRLFDLGLEYRYISLYLQNKMTKQDMLEKLELETWHYAKRQMTWFKRNKKIIWVDNNKDKEVLKVIKNHLTKNK